MSPPTPNPEVLLSAEKIAERVSQLAQQISADYQGRPIVVIGILTGAVIFLSDLIRQVSCPVILDLMKASSYGLGTASSKTVRLTHDIETDITGHDVLVVEDIVDTGHTLTYILDTLKARKPKSLKICTLLDKPSRREVTIPVDYVGFEIPNIFVVGYGLDLAGQYRQLPYIGVAESH